MEIIATFHFGDNKIYGLVIRVDFAETDITVNQDLVFRLAKTFRDFLPHLFRHGNHIVAILAVAGFPARIGFAR